MAFLQLVKSSLETAGHGIAVGATALADEVTGGNVPEVKRARREQEQRLREAAQRASAGASGSGLDRIVGTIGASLSTISEVARNPEQLRRLLEVVEKHDFAALLRALQNGAQFEDDFFPSWIRRAGGYFPKFAQVLSVRADLIRNPRVLAGLGRCLEDMPSRGREDVLARLRALGWTEESLRGLGPALNAGTIAQVNELRLPRGGCVVKLAFQETKQQVQTDFRLFGHARQILHALQLETEQAQVVAALFAAVGKSESAVMAEFDLAAEAAKLGEAGRLAAEEWPAAHELWLAALPTVLAGQPPVLAALARTHAQGLQGKVRVPQAVDGMVGASAFAMTRAEGESLHKMLQGEQRQEAAGVALALAVPFVGWLLLCKSSTNLGHVDPHPGNFRWCSNSRELWVLDWGSSVRLSEDKRRALCLLVRLVAEDAEAELLGDVARSFGLGGQSAPELARLVRGILNASTAHAAQEALEGAALDGILENVSDDVVPVVRCLSLLGGLLKELQRSARREHGQEVPLSLAALWSPFALLGLDD